MRSFRSSGRTRRPGRSIGVIAIATLSLTLSLGVVAATPDGASRTSVAGGEAAPAPVGTPAWLDAADRIAAGVTGTTRYVSCRVGDDRADGRSTATALRTVAAVDRLALAPGDRVLFERGCAWTETLHADWSGTPAAPITFGAYGAGPRPRFTNTKAQAAAGFHISLWITGTHQVFDGLEATLVDPPRSPCGGNALGWFIGFAITPGTTPSEQATGNVVRNSRASGFTAGAHIAFGANGNTIEQSEFVGNGAMSTLTDDGITHNPDGEGDDIGAWGVLLNGSGNLIDRNHFEDNVGVCAYDTKPQGNAVELYEASDNVISRNVSVDDQTFSELGSSAEHPSSGNQYVYNEIRSDVPDAVFIVARGDESVWGPTSATLVAHNTLYYSGTESAGVVCHSGCGPEIMVMEGNIIWVEGKALFTDLPFPESHNLYWNERGDPFLQFLRGSMSPTSTIADPGFVSLALDRVDLDLDSVAIDGARTRHGHTDVAGQPIATTGAPDIGAHEADPARVSRWRTTGVDILIPDLALKPVG